MNIVEKARKAAALTAGVSVEELTGPSRRWPLPVVRAMAYQCLREDMSCIEVGKAFNRDHVTVLHGVKRLKDLMDFDLETQKLQQRFNVMLYKQKNNYVD